MSAETYSFGTQSKTWQHKGPQKGSSPTLTILISNIDLSCSLSWHKRRPLTVCFTQFILVLLKCLFRVMGATLIRWNRKIIIYLRFVDTHQTVVFTKRGKHSTTCTEIWFICKKICIQKSDFVVSIICYDKGFRNSLGDADTGQHVAEGKSYYLLPQRNYFCFLRHVFVIFLLVAIPSNCIYIYIYINPQNSR